MVLACATAGVTVVLITCGLVLLGYVGVVLPAVWSTRPARRKAAADVLYLFWRSHPSPSRLEQADSFKSTSDEVAAQPGIELCSCIPPIGTD